MYQWGQVRAMLSQLREQSAQWCVCVWLFKALGRALTSCAVVTLPVWSTTTLFTVDAATLNASARLTNIRFTSDLQDPSSQAYKNLTGSILAEVSFMEHWECCRAQQAFNPGRRLRHQIYESLSAEVRAMWESGQVRVEIRGLAPGSVAANLTIIFTLSHNGNISNASAAISRSLMNTSKYSVDPSSIHVTGTCLCSFKGAF